MSRFFLSFAFILISFVAYGFYLSQFEFNLIPRSQRPDVVPFYDYTLSNRIYTNLSIGSGDPLSISNEAKSAQIDYVLLTDRNPYYNLDSDVYINDVGVLTGATITVGDRQVVYYSPENKNFYENPFAHSTASDALIIETQSIQNKYNLDHLQKSEFDGLEVINFKNISQNSWTSSRISTLWSILYYPFNPRLALIRLFKEPADELRLFDQLSQEKKVGFFLGAEATAKAIPFADWLIKFPSYERSFSIASYHLMANSELKGVIKDDAKNILSLLKKGYFYIAFDALGDPAGFENYLSNKITDKKYFTGDTVSYNKNLQIYYKLPTEPNVFYEVVLIKNGQRVDHLNTFEGIFNIETKGVYRLQVRLSPRLPLPDAIKWLTWIYTNNFYVE